MIPIENINQITTSSIQHPYESSHSSSTSSSGAFYNFYSPIQSILSFLNFTSLFQGSSSLPPNTSLSPTVVSPLFFLPRFKASPYLQAINSSFLSDNYTSLPIPFWKVTTHTLSNSDEDLGDLETSPPSPFGKFSTEVTNGLKILHSSNAFEKRAGRGWVNDNIANESTPWTLYSDTEGVWRWETSNVSWNGSLEATNTSLVYDETTTVTIITAVILAFVILLTVVGNVFVIAAILLERNLQSVANYLILSLAVTDLLVAALVMPLSAVYEVSKEWTFGPELCDMWTVSDVLCCTASILHLVAIAIDRYWAVTNIDYIQQRSPKRVCTMIVAIWSVSTLISAAPLMGWKDSEWHGRVRRKICLVSQDIYYQVFATMTSFYLPLAVILFLYWRIYQAARKRIRHRLGPRTQSALCRGPVTISETTTFTRVSSRHDSPERPSNGTLTDGSDSTRNEEDLRFKMAALPLNPLALLGTRAPRRRELDARRERKAAKTLAVITGVFVMCWLPFFIMALLMPLCTYCYFSPYLVATLLWLGYFNSTLNPILYTVFSPDFRNAFRRILFGKRRLRKRQYDARVSSIKGMRS